MPRLAVLPTFFSALTAGLRLVFPAQNTENRIEQNLTQEMMAFKLNMQTPNYSRLEGGAFPKDPRRIVEIARILRVDLNWLFGFAPDDAKS